MAEILVIADIHLSPANPQTDTFAALIARAAKADALYILGDLFDYWVGDDQPLPDAIGHTLDQLSALPCKKYFQAGNRDFLVGQNLLDRIGAEYLPDVFPLAHQGEIILLCHGDRLSHHIGISSMESAGNVGRCEVRDYLLVKSQFVDAKTFPNVRV